MPRCQGHGGAGQRRPRATPVLLASLFATAACQPEATPPHASVRDSAGVTIVQNRLGLWPHGHGWRLSEQPTVEIGIGESAAAHQFLDVVGAVRLSDGRFVVANSGRGELQFFDSGGAFLSTAGESGSDPGEFAGLLHLWRLSADTLVTYDWGNQRVSLFDAWGDLLRAFSLEAGTEAAAVPFPVGFFADGSFLVNEGSMLESGAPSVGLIRDSTEYLLYDRTGTRLQTLGRFPGRLFFLPGAPGPAVTEAPFSPQPTAAVYGDGFYFGSGDAYEIGYYARNGALTRLIRKADPERRVTARDIDLYKQHRLQRARDALDRRRIEQQLRNLPFPETLPAYADLQVDAHGNLWVEDFPRPGDDAFRWSVFEPGGQLLGAVEAPARFTVYQIGPDFLLGSWQDEFGIEHVHLYELIKPPELP